MKNGILSPSGVDVLEAQMRAQAMQQQAALAIVQHDLRDQFAMQAMNAMLWPYIPEDKDEFRSHRISGLAGFAYLIADEMLKARVKHPAELTTQTNGQPPNAVTGSEK